MYNAQVTIGAETQGFELVKRHGYNYVYDVLNRQVLNEGEMVMVMMPNGETVTKKVFIERTYTEEGTPRNKAYMRLKVKGLTVQVNLHGMLVKRVEAENA